MTLPGSLCLCLTLIAGATAAGAQSIEGFAIGAPFAAAAASRPRPTMTGPAGANLATKWVLPAGQVLSVTRSPQTDRILFVEEDWGQPASAGTGLPGLTFGQTTLADIRTRFGSNGFGFRANLVRRMGTDLIATNCYTLARTPGGTLALVTGQPIAGIAIVDGRPRVDTGRGTLRAIILSDEAYLQQLWGDGRLFDPAAHPVDLR